MLCTAAAVSLVFLFGQGIAVPVVERAPGELVVRKQDCPVTQQANACMGGIAYCCVADNKGHACKKSTVTCTTIVICCNNAFGVQSCVGDLNFSGPVVIQMGT
jgi:hypothetical protein